MILPAAFAVRDAVALAVQIVNLPALRPPASIRFQWANGQQDMSVRIAVTLVMERKVGAHSLCYKIVFDESPNKCQLLRSGQFHGKGNFDFTGKLGIAGFLDLCFILGCPFRKAICFLLPSGVRRFWAGLVRVLDGKISKTFSWRLQWTRPPTEIWCSPTQRSPSVFCHPHTSEGGAAESQ